MSVTVLAPLAVLLLGLWEENRGSVDLADLSAEHEHLEGVVSALEGRLPRDGRIDFGMQFRWGGQTYAGPYALDKAREALSDVAMTERVAQARRVIPLIVVATAGLAAGLALVVLAVSTALGRAGRRSRDALVRGFALVRRVLPAALGLQIVLATAAFVAAMTFEACALLRPGVLSTGEIKLLLLALLLVVGSLWMAGSTLLQLRRTLAAFTPDPLPILGRLVPREAAPGLWRLVDTFADRLGALRPDHVVVGLTEGFFVSSGAKRLEPGGQTLEGRTLYVPLPILPFLRPDEAAAVIGHELAHFSGDDTDYSLRFLPIYVGVGRSLDAVAGGGADGRGAGSPLLGPALRLGVFVMDQFHHAVRHWSRQREFAADAAGAGLTSSEAAARALLRTVTLGPRIEEVLAAAANAPDLAAPDLVAAVLHHVASRGLDDPAAHLDAAQPHPTDTHPPTRQRLEALGHAAEPGLIATVVTVPPPEALGGLHAYFADPQAICRAATADFLGVMRGRAAAYHAHLEATAAAVEGEVQVLREGTRRSGLVALGGGGLFFCLALLFAVIKLPGLALGEGRFAAATLVPFAIAFLAWGVFQLRRGERTFLILRPDALTVPGLDRPIPWADVADLDLSLRNRRIAMRLLLPPDTPFPARGPGRRVKLDAGRRIVTVSALLPQGMSVQAFANLIGRYRAADEARQLLAAEHHGPAGEAAAGV